MLLSAQLEERSRSGRRRPVCQGVQEVSGSKPHPCSESASSPELTRLSCEAGCPQETRADGNYAELGQARLPLGVLPLCSSLGDISLMFQRKVVMFQWKGCSTCQTYKKKRKHKLGNATRDGFKWTQCWVCVFLGSEKPKTSSLEIAFRIL